MKKRTTKLLILVLILILVICGAALAIHFANQAEANVSTEPTAETYEVYSFDLDTLDHLTWYHSDVGFEQNLLRGAGDSWYVEDHENFELDPKIVAAFFNAYTFVSSTKKVDLKPAEVGLDDPSAYVILYFKDGSTQRLEFGDNASTSAYCYMTPDGGKNIYVVKRSGKLMLYRYYYDFTTEEEE